MANQNVICVFCKKKIEKEIAYKVGNKQYFCNSDCYQKHLDKLKFKLQKPSSNTEVASRKKCLDYIQLLYREQGFKDCEINWALIGQQIKRQMDDNKDFKWSGIQYVLWYLKEIKGINLFDNGYNGSVVNLVPFYFQEARQFWIEKHNINKAISEQGDDFMNDKCVYIRSCNNSKNRLKSIINIEEL